MLVNNPITTKGRLETLFERRTIMDFMFSVDPHEKSWRRPGHRVLQQWIFSAWYWIWCTSFLL